MRVGLRIEVFLAAVGAERPVGAGRGRGGEIQLPAGRRGRGPDLQLAQDGADRPDALEIGVAGEVVAAGARRLGRRQQQWRRPT